MEKKIACYVSRFGLPTLAESGGSNGKTGYACIIANKNGNRKTPIYIPRHGNLSNSEHAFFVIKQEDIRIEVTHLDQNFKINVYKIDSIDIPHKEVSLVLVESYSDKSEYFNSKYFKAISVAISKSIALFCEEPMYIYSTKKIFEKKLVTNLVY